MGDATNLIPTRELAQGVADRLPLLINQLGNEILVRAEPRLQAVGLSARGYLALAVLSADRPSSQLELSRLLGCVPAVVVALADELEDAGHVERARDPADRRRSVLAVTKAGRRALAAGDAVAREVEDELLGHVEPEARERLHAVLRTALDPAGATAPPSPTLAPAQG